MKTFYLNNNIRLTLILYVMDNDNSGMINNYYYDDNTPYSKWCNTITLLVLNDTNYDDPKGTKIMSSFMINGAFKFKIPKIRKDSIA